MRKLPVGNTTPDFLNSCWGRQWIRPSMPDLQRCSHPFSTSWLCRQGRQSLTDSRTRRGSLLCVETNPAFGTIWCGPYCALLLALRRWLSTSSVMSSFRFTLTSFFDSPFFAPQKFLTSSFRSKWLPFSIN